MLLIDKQGQNEGQTTSVFNVIWPGSAVSQVILPGASLDERDCCKYILGIEDEIRAFHKKEDKENLKS